MTRPKSTAPNVEPNAAPTPESTPEQAVNRRKRSQFRAAQTKILNYKSGKMAVSAVPGAGKTFTLAHLAARLVGTLSNPKQEILVVTFSNSAVNALKGRIAEILSAERGLLSFGYRVRTLHGLAHDIVRERPGLAGLAEDFKIMDERTSAALLRDSADTVLRTHGKALLEQYASTDWQDPRKIESLLRERFSAHAVDIATRFIQQAKDRLMNPQQVRAALEQSSYDSDPEFALARFCAEVYTQYAQSLSYRGAVDFDDLVRLAFYVLSIDAGYLDRLRERFPFILEDEAQDSSALQEKMLGLLSRDKNWVRVGDPNQSINTTFTTARADLFRDFLDRRGVKSYTLPEAGRSAPKIIDLANFLVRWTRTDHPNPALQTAFVDQAILPVQNGKNAPIGVGSNPPDSEAQIYIAYNPEKPITPDDELNLVVRSLAQWLPNHPDETVAVLVPENSRGFKITAMLREAGLEYEEMLRSTSQTRDVAAALESVLRYLANPTESNLLGRLYRDLWFPTHLGLTGITGLTADQQADQDQAEANTKLRDRLVNALQGNQATEAFLFPPDARYWQEVLNLNVLDELSEDQSAQVLADLEAFRVVIGRWLRAVNLPIDQLILTVNQDLFSEATAIALAYKIAGVLRGMASANPSWRLIEFASELKVIASNERRFIGFEDAERGYEPHPGRVTVSTMHAAKGLEWDRVYLMAVSDYSFPSAQSSDSYVAEKYYVRPYASGRLNLEAEALEQLRILAEKDPYVEGAATELARIAIAAERLRLLYVGITRAKRELMISYNTGRYADKGMENGPALPMIALWDHVKLSDKAT